MNTVVEYKPEHQVENSGTNNEISLDQIVVQKHTSIVVANVSDEQSSESYILQPQTGESSSSSTTSTSTTSSSTTIHNPPPIVPQPAPVAQTIELGAQAAVKRYNVTRNAGIRMVIFTSLFLILNVAATMGTILAALKGTEVDAVHIGGQDLVASTMGIFVFLIFGTVPEAKKALRQLFSCSEI